MRLLNRMRSEKIDNLSAVRSRLLQPAEGTRKITTTSAGLEKLIAVPDGTMTEVDTWTRKSIATAVT